MIRANKMPAFGNAAYNLVVNRTTDGAPVGNHSAVTQLRSNFDKAVYDVFKTVVPVTFTVFVLLGILGNGLVIYVIAYRRKLRTVTNLLLANLAVADVAFLFVCGSFTVVHYAFDIFPLGDVPCQIIQYLLFTTCYVSVYTLAAVSAVRFIVVVHGSDHPLVRSKVYVKLLIIGIWLLFLVANVPVTAIHHLEFDPRTNRTECIIDGIDEGRKLFLLTFLLAYAFPLIVIIAFYLAVVRHLRKTGNCVTQHVGHVTKVTAIVVLVFAICWIPLHVHLLVGYYGDLPHGIAYGSLLLVWHVLVFVNSMINPIIYNIFSKDFRREFVVTLSCCIGRTEPIAQNV